MVELVLNNVMWSFIGDQYKSQNQFYKEFIEYQDDLENLSFKPENMDELIISSPSIKIKYWGLKNDEHLEMVVVFNADNGLAFSVGELMFKLHNSVVNYLNDLDHHFYEGLEPKIQSGNNEIVYSLWLGS